jgi:hypothetical protein
MCLIFYYLQNCYLNEFNRASRNLGDYKVNELYSKKLEIKPVENYIHYKNIIEYVKGEIINIPENQEERNRKSDISMARFAIENGFISLNPKLQCFTIRSFSDPDKANVVHLQPKPSCNCPSKVKCYHIITAQMSIGSHDMSEKISLNLSNLMKGNERSKHSKSDKKKF